MKRSPKDHSQKTVNTATLKAELAKYLRLVEAGGEVVVLHHKAAIAKIIPFYSPEVPLDSIKPKKDFSGFAKMQIPKKRSTSKVDSLTLLLQERGER